jgi:hypothetical protein
MMYETKFRGHRIQYDPVATAQAFMSAKSIGPESCTCIWCRNFIVVRDRAYTEDLRRLALTVGNVPIREVEVWEAGPGKEEGTRLYGGWFHFVGEIDRDQEWNEQESLWSMSLSSANSMLPESFKGHPVVQVDFTCEAPWVLDEEPPE